MAFSCFSGRRVSYLGPFQYMYHKVIDIVHVHVPQSTDTQSLARIICNVYTGYHGTSEIEHGLCACTVDNPLAKARGLSLHTGAQTMLYLSHVGYRRTIIIAKQSLTLFVL